MIYNRIATLRVDRKMSRKALAEKIEVNYQTVGFIERGDYVPSLELAFKLASLFEVPIEFIFSDQPFGPILKQGEPSNASR